MKKFIIFFLLLFIYKSSWATSSGWYSTLQGNNSDIQSGQIPNGSILQYNTSTEEWTFSYASVPAGGSTGYVLSKNSSSDYDYSWQPGGSGGTPTWDAILSPIGNQVLNMSTYTTTWNNVNGFTWSGFNNLNLSGATITSNANITTTGNVGIGTANPIGGLNVEGNDVNLFKTTSSGVQSKALNIYAQNGHNISIFNDSYGDSIIQTTDPMYLRSTSAYSQFVIDSGASKYLDLNVASNAPIFMGNGNVGIGTFLPTGGLAVMNGNVGIGTWVPGAALQVMGNVGIGTATSINSVLKVGGTCKAIGPVGTCWTSTGQLGYCSGVAGACTSCTAC